MILGDLLDARVLGPDGAALGFVVDVRLELEVLAEEDPGNTDDRGRGGGDDGDRRTSAESTDGPALATLVRRRDPVGRACVVGILVSPRHGGSLHGYERTGVTAPWPVPQLVRRRHRGTYLVPWSDVAAVVPGEVRLAEGFRREDAALP